MSAKIIYKDIAVGAAEDASVTSASADARSDVTKLPMGVVHPDFVTLELNKWGGSGTKKIYNGQEVALVSTEMSGVDCAFSTPPTLTVELEKNYTAQGISFRFATNSVDYPTSLTLAWYQDAALLDEKTFYPDGVNYFCQNKVEVFNKLVVTINSTNLPYRYARMEQILFGIVREFTGSELGRAHVLQEIDLISATISVNTLDWKLKSRSGVDYMFQLKQPIELYNNSNLVGVFYVDDNAKRTAENTYEVPCCDAIGVLDGYSFEAVMYSGKNAIEALEEIVGSVFELEIDSSFNSVSLTGLNPAGTRRSAIQQIAFAIGAVVDTSGTHKIRIYPADSTAPAEIPKSRVYIGGAVEQGAIVTAVEVTYHTYTPGAGTSGDDVITVGGVRYVHTTGVIRIDNPNVTATDKQNVKTVTDCTLVNATNVAYVAVRYYAYHEKRNTISSRIVVDGEKPGDYVSIPTAWGQTLMGSIESMNLRLSNTTAADVTLKGAG